MPSALSAVSRVTEVRAEAGRGSSLTWFYSSSQGAAGVTQPFLSCLISSTFSTQLQHEKAELEQHLEQEQEFQVNKLMKKIKKMENETIAKQLTLEQVD